MRTNPIIGLLESTGIFKKPKSKWPDDKWALLGLNRLLTRTAEIDTINHHLQENIHRPHNMHPCLICMT